MVVFVIIAFILLFVCLLLIIQNKVKCNTMLYRFKIGNVIVCGHKGTGKDLVFQYVINHRKKYYYSNISYGGQNKIISLNDVSVAPNDYNKLINNEVVKTPHMFKENCDIYISDGGNFLPSQMDSQLHKKYPSMPIFYSLSRHLYNNNVHVNTQNIERVWKALREQADYYIVVKRTYKLFGFIFFTKVITYDKYESCKNNILPLKKRLFNKDSKNQFDLFTAQNGIIDSFFVIQFKNQLHYNTRAFEKVLLKGKRKYAN